MKKLKIYYLKKYNYLITVLLTLLGFTTACEQTADEYGSPAPEYGVPQAEFIVKGTVRSLETLNSISGIEVTMNYDTVYSDQNGNFEVKNTAFPSTQNFPLKFSDKDGIENGEFLNLDTTIVFQDPQFTGGQDFWDKGKTEKEIDIKLRPKK